MHKISTSSDRRDGKNKIVQTLNEKLINIYGKLVDCSLGFLLDIMASEFEIDMKDLDATGLSSPCGRVLPRERLYSRRNSLRFLVCNSKLLSHFDTPLTDCCSVGHYRNIQSTH